jgi:hypothetical protein
LLDESGNILTDELGNRFTDGTCSGDLPICYEALVMVKQAQSAGGTPVTGGFPQAGPAVTARSDWLAGLLSYQTDSLQGNIPSTTVYYSAGNPPLSLWGGVGSLLAGDPFAITQIVDAVVTSGLNGRFNTTANANGNWLESDSSFDITLSPLQTAFGCYVMDLGDAGATLQILVYSGPTLLETIVVPSTPPDAPSSDEAMWVGYENTGVPFDKVSFVITQSAPDSADYDIVGFDDFAIGLHPPCTPA